jgi:prephenate dehydratase/chorismate mutase/prephenate dehydratase
MQTKQFTANNGPGSQKGDGANGASLSRIRKRIDQCDLEIVRLLQERLELALRTKRLKPEVQDREREVRILEKIRKSAGQRSLLRSEFIEKLVSVILQESRQVQEQERQIIGFQGEHGAYSEEAARHFDPGLVAVPCAEFFEVFSGVETGSLDLGIVPVENSLGGAVSQVNELLLATSLHVVAAVKLRINHCLLALPETDYREIRVVTSHPQALSQCRRFLARNKLEPRPFYDTAGAARALARDKEERTAVIASALAADLYNLDVLKDHIQDNPANFTRFFILARERAGGPFGPGAKNTIAFSTAHRAGTLFEVLRIFAQAGINLTRIESLPSPQDPAHFAFFLDFQLENGGQEIEAALAEVQELTVMFKDFGCYQEACP